MIAFFFWSLVMVPRVKKSPEFRSRVRIITIIKKKEKNLRLVKKCGLGKKFFFLNNKNNFLLRDHKAKNKMI